MDIFVCTILIYGLFIFHFYQQKLIIHSQLLFIYLFSTTFSKQTNKDKYLDTRIIIIADLRVRTVSGTMSRYRWQFSIRVGRHPKVLIPRRLSFLGSWPCGFYGRRQNRWRVCGFCHRHGPTWHRAGWVELRVARILVWGVDSDRTWLKWMGTQSAANKTIQKEGS